VVEHVDLDEADEDVAEQGFVLVRDIDPR